MFGILSNLIPGASAAKNIASAGGGLALGVGITSIINKVENSKKKKEIASLKEENQILQDRLGNVNLNDEKKTIIKVGILKQFAWVDGEFHEKEFKFITNYIIKSNKLECDIKIMLIDDLNIKPPLVKMFKDPVISFFKNNKKFFDCEEEKFGFISTLERVMNIDGDAHKKEIKFIENLKKI